MIAKTVQINSFEVTYSEDRIVMESEALAKLTGAPLVLNLEPVHRSRLLVNSGFFGEANGGYWCTLVQEAGGLISPTLATRLDVAQLPQQLYSTLTEDSRAKIILHVGLGSNVTSDWVVYALDLERRKLTPIRAIFSGMSSALKRDLLDTLEEAINHYAFNILRLGQSSQPVPAPLPLVRQSRPGALDFRA